MSHHAEDFEDIRAGVRAVCAEFPDEYHRQIDRDRGYPEEFVEALTRAGWMAAPIPETYGGSGPSLTEASVTAEEINRAGGPAPVTARCTYEHADPAWLEDQRRTYSPKIASGELRLQSMGVTEPTTGTDTR